MAKNDSDHLVKATVELAARLGVFRQALHTWRKRSNAPEQVGGFWDVRQWQRFIEQANLAGREPRELPPARARITRLSHQHHHHSIVSQPLYIVIAKAKVDFHGPQLRGTIPQSPTGFRRFFTQLPAGAHLIVEGSAATNGPWSSLLMLPALRSL